jgi:hypothetical protein
MNLNQTMPVKKEDMSVLLKEEPPKGAAILADFDSKDLTAAGSHTVPGESIDVSPIHIQDSKPGQLQTISTQQPMPPQAP